MKHVFKCWVCKETKTHKDDHTTGYARYGTRGLKVCFACCAVKDRESMLEHGDSKRLPLYLTELPDPPELGTFKSPKFKVSNWPGTLEFPVTGYSRGSHNIAGSRIDVWFMVSGQRWWGYQIGDYTQIVHCKRVQG